MVQRLSKAGGKKRIFGSFVGARRRHFGMRSRRLSISGLTRWTSCYCLTRPRPEIIYHNTAGYDQSQNALLYRRDLIYTVEYPTVTTAQQPSMLFGAFRSK